MTFRMLPTPRQRRQHRMDIAHGIGFAATLILTIGSVFLNISLSIDRDPYAAAYVTLIFASLGVVVWITASIIASDLNRRRY